MKKPKVSPLSCFAGHDRQSMRGMMAAYLEWMAVRNYTEQSVSSRAQTLHYFATWCAERGISKPTEVTRPIILRYQRWLFYCTHEPRCRQSAGKSWSLGDFEVSMKCTLAFVVGAPRGALHWALPEFVQEGSFSASLAHPGRRTASQPG